MYGNAKPLNMKKKISQTMKPNVRLYMRTNYTVWGIPRETTLVANPMDKTTWQSWLK